MRFPSIDSLKAAAYDLLRSTEKYAKTDMVYAAKGGFWLLLGHAVQAASGLVLAVAFANLVPKETYGTYQFIMAVTALIAAFTLTGMGTAITRAVAQGSEGALRAGFRVQLVWSSAMIFVGAALAIYYFLNDNQVLATSFLIAGALSPFMVGFGLSRSYLVGKQLFRESALFGFWRKLIPVVVVLGALVLTQDVVLLVTAYFLSNVFAAGLLYVAIVRRYRLPRGEEKEMVAYSKHLSLLHIMSEIVNQADKVVIWVLLGAAPLAAYALAMLPIVHLRQAFGLLSSLTFPKLATMTLTEAQVSLPPKVRRLLLVAGLAVAGYVLIAPFFFGLLFPDYPESILLSQALALLILSKPRALYGQAFTAHGMKREQYITNTSANVLRLILLATLVPFFGLWGVVWALLATHFFLNVLTRYLFFTVHEH